MPDRGNKGCGKDVTAFVAVPMHGTKMPTEGSTYFLYPSYGPTTVGLMM